MNDPQQIRRALSDVRKALDSHSRESMVEILALVFKEYVVEGAQPLSSGGAVIDARTDLEGLSFAELIVWLQTHVDVPELSLFEVSGADVTVRGEAGTQVRLRARSSSAPMPAALPAAVPVAAPPTVRAQPMPTPNAAPTPAPAAAAPAVPAQPAQQATTGQVTPGTGPSKEENTAESGTRFSLLEVD